MQNAELSVTGSQVCVTEEHSHDNGDRVITFIIMAYGIMSYSNDKMAFTFLFAQQRLILQPKLYSAR